MKDFSGLKFDIKNFCEENGPLKAILLDNLLNLIWQFLFSSVMIVFSLQPYLAMNIFEQNIFCLFVSMLGRCGCQRYL